MNFENLSNDLQLATKIFADDSTGKKSPVSVLGHEMNRTQPIYMETIRSFIVASGDHFAASWIMRTVLIAWHAVVKANRCQLPRASAEDINRNLMDFVSWYRYYQGEDQAEEKSKIQFFRCKELEDFTCFRICRLNEDYPPGTAPLAAPLIFALMKTLDDAIFAHQSKSKKT
jgi:hypothetical protein